MAENVEFGRNSVRDYFFKMFTEKVCRTSYINLESEDFLKKMYETKVHCTNKNYSIHETSRNFHTLGENQVYKINNFLKAKKVLWQNLHYSSELLIAFLESSKEF